MVEMRKIWVCLGSRIDLEGRERLEADDSDGPGCLVVPVTGSKEEEEED